MRGSHTCFDTVQQIQRNKKTKQILFTFLFGRIPVYSANQNQNQSSTMNRSETLSQKKTRSNDIEATAYSFLNKDPTPQSGGFAHSETETIPMETN